MILCLDTSPYCSQKKSMQANPGTVLLHVTRRAKRRDFCTLMTLR